jgi:hypothetical protein
MPRLKIGNRLYARMLSFTIVGGTAYGGWGAEGKPEPLRVREQGPPAPGEIPAICYDCGAEIPAGALYGLSDTGRRPYCLACTREDEPPRVFRHGLRDQRAATLAERARRAIERETIEYLDKREKAGE